MLASHQAEAVAWILETLKGRHGALLCDDVGLGKSWVAATVGWVLRSAGWTVEIVVPAMLRESWRRTLVAFELDAGMTTHEALRNRAIVPGDGTTLVIVDEAHRFRNPATAMHRALARLSAGRRMLLVTATPVWNSTDDLRALLQIVAPDDALRGAGVVSIDQAVRGAGPMRVVLDALSIRRDGARCGLARDLARVQTSVVRFDIEDPGGEIARGIERLRFPLVSPRAHGAFLRDFMWRRLSSSEAALGETLRRQRRFHLRAREAAARGLRLSRDDYRGIFGDDPDDSPVQEILFPELWMQPDTGTAHLDSEIEAEIDSIETLRSAIRGATASKFGLLEALLSEGEQPSLVFTSSIATAKGLFGALHSKRRCALLTAGETRLAATRRAPPGKVVEAFQEGRLDLLIATDCGAEGLDLQRAARVFHYDLPWTSVRVRQRVGRARRLGQERDVVASILFVPRGGVGRSIARILIRKARLERTVHAEPRERGAVVDERILRSRQTMPSALSRGSPQFAMFERLEREDLLDDDLAARLTRRYRAGVETIIGEVAREALDGHALEDLRLLLRSEGDLGVSGSSPCERRRI